jgi:hypothetical protein
MLGNRSNSEVMPLSPFISGWHPILDELDEYPVSDHILEQMFDYVMAGANQPGGSLTSNMNPREGFKVALRNLLQRQNKAFAGGVFRMLAYAMTDFLVDRLVPHPQADLDYLRPLLNLSKDSLSIYSLNYDTVIEKLCAQESRHTSMGVRDFPEDSGLIEFDESSLRLVKLHGSIDWRWTRYRSAYSYPRVCRVTDFELVNRLMRPIVAAPALIFGQGNKLTVEGPFLQLLNFFQTDLEKHDQLIVIGYSFRDPHATTTVSLR